MSGYQEAALPGPRPRRTHKETVTSSSLNTLHNLTTPQASALASRRPTVLRRLSGDVE